MDSVIVVLRLIHILDGVFWAGSAIFFAGFLTPAVKTLGQERGRFMRTLMEQQRVTVAFSVASGLTVLSGLILMWLDSGGSLSWFTTGAGFWLGLGGAFGLAGMVVGGGVVGRTTRRMAAVGAAIQAGGQPPTPEQIQELNALNARLEQAGVINAALLIVALIGMTIGGRL